MTSMEEIRQWAKTRMAITEKAIHDKFDISFSNAFQAIQILKEEGLITEDWDVTEGGYRVLGRQTETILDLPDVAISEDGRVLVTWNPVE